LVLAFHHPILLRGLRGSELLVHPALCTIPTKPNRSDPSSTISVEDLQLVPCVHLNAHLEVLDREFSVILAWQEHQPHEAVEIIDEQQEVLVATRSGGGDGITKVTMNQVEDAACTSVCLLGEGCVTVLASEAGIADLPAPAVAGRTP
jgi:hypothetical protein